MFQTNWYKKQISMKCMERKEFKDKEKTIEEARKIMTIVLQNKTIGENEKNSLISLGGILSSGHQQEIIHLFIQRVECKKFESAQQALNQLNSNNLTNMQELENMIRGLFLPNNPNKKQSKNN